MLINVTALTISISPPIGFYIAIDLLLLAFLFHFHNCKCEEVYRAI